MSELTTRDASQLVVSDSTKKYIGESKSPSTIRVYHVFLQEFGDYAAWRNAPELPASPALVADYAAYLADNRHLADPPRQPLKPASIASHLSAISWAHRIADVADPTTFKLVRETLAGIRRKLGTAPNKREAAVLESLDAMVATLPDTIKGKRDRALLLVGFGGAFRRSELVALNVDDMTFSLDLKIRIRKSKTDQTGEGETKTLPRIGGDLCPVAALESWLEAADIKSGAIFRRCDRHGNVWAGRLSEQSVALVIKVAARDAGLDYSKFAGHSLRSGFVTEAFDNDASETDVAQVTLHKDLRTLRSYRQATGVGARKAVRAAFGHTDD